MATNPQGRGSCCEREKAQCVPAESAAGCSQRPPDLQDALQKNTLDMRKVNTQNRLIGERELGVGKPIDLERRIQRKVVELVQEEETLVNLYRKAAEEAKEKEKEFKEKTALLMKQIEKDKHLMDCLKRAN